MAPSLRYRPLLSSEIVLALHPDGPLPVGVHSIAGEGRQQDEDGDHLDHKSARESTQQGRRHVRSFTLQSTGISSHLGPKLRDWAVRQAGAGCYSWAALSSNDSKTR